MVLSLDRPVLLVGLPGAGKSSTGRKLAARIGCAFADSDAVIEEEAGRSIPDIFAREGEAGFRARERAVVLRLIEGDPGVIALGGGAFADPQIRAAALARATTFWLDVAEAVLVHRISAGTGRPLFEGRDVRTTLRELAAAREAHYAQAHHRVRAARSGKMAARILALLDQSSAAAARASR